MGKNTGQRTKNNAKPSKSNRSAELLYKASPNFLGPAAEKDGSCTSILPVLLTKPFNETTVNEVDSSFLLVFKKLSKKDTTTKFKALQEFITLCNDSPLSSVETIIPYWPKIYCILSVDFEHKIREAVQLAHGALIKRVGKSIAAHLKQFAAYWFTSQFDTYPPVASAATKSFHETFAGKKYSDAIIYCQNEILSYICDEITTYKFPSKKNNESNNDSSNLLEIKQQRILICCLQGYCFYLKNIPTEQLHNTIEIHKQIIASPNFWKFAECNVSVIKIAFFNIIMLIIENASDLLADKKKKIITTVVNNINENDPGVVVAVWESLFTVLNKYSDWHEIINVEKMMLPKLWNLLKNGGHGCANTIFPALLPLIYQFYKFNFDMKNFFTSLFNNIRQSFNIKAVQNSYSERLIIAKSFIECLRYALVMNCNDVDFNKQLIEEQLMPTIELYITVYPSKRTDIFNEISSLVRYWSKNRKSEKGQCYEELMKTFWDKLELLFEKLIINTKDNTYQSPINIHEMGVELLFSLQKPKLLSCKNTSVKFQDTSDSKEKPTSIEKPVYHDDEFDKELQNFVNKLCIKYFNAIHNSSTNIYISIITLIISRFDSESLFKVIASSYGHSSLLEFYNNVILKHFITTEEGNSSSIEIIFALIKYMADEEKSIVLNSLAELNDSQVLMDVISQGLMEKNVNDTAVKKFFKSQRVTECFHEIVRQFISGTSNKSIKNLLIQTFQKIHNDFCISEEAVQDVINVICDTLKTSDDISQDVIEFFVHLLRTTWNHEQVTDANLEMLRILVQINISNTYTEDLKNFLRHHWVDELQFIHKNFLLTQILRIQKSIMETIYETIFSVDQFNEDAAEIAQSLIEYSSGCDYCQAIKALYTVNSSNNSSLKKWISQFQNIISNAEIITGNYYIINPTQILSFEPPSAIFTSVEVESLSKNIIKCNQWSLLNVTLLNDFLKKFIDDDTIDELEEFFHDNSSDTFVMLNDILLIMSLSKLYCKHYKFTSSYQSISELYNQLEQKYTELQTLIPKNTWHNIFTTYINFNHGWSEFGSIFLQYLQYFNVDNSCLLEMKSSEKTILEAYVKQEKESSNFTDHINAILSARSILDNSKNQEESHLSIDLLNRLIKAHKNEEYFFILTKSDLSSISWSDFSLTLEVIRLFTKSIITVPTQLDTKVWDSAMIYLTSWLRSLNNYKNSHKDLKLQCLTVASCQLFCAIQRVINEYKSSSINQLFSKLADEWNSVFVRDIQQEIVNIWMYYGKVYDKKCDDLPSLLMLHYLGDAIRLIDESFFLTLFSPTSVDTQSLKKLSLELMLSPVTCNQLSAYYLFNSSVPALVEQDKVLIKDEEPDFTKFHIHDFFNILSQVQEVVNTMLESFKLCESVKCIIEPYTDSYTCVLGYLLTWVNILKMCEIANTNLRCQYAEILKDDYFHCLMNNIFKMMPTNLFEEPNIKVPNARLARLFQVPPSLDFYNDMSAQKIDHIVCWLYVICLRNLPVLTRQWWSTVNSKVSNLVEKVTTVYVSPILCQEELSDKKLSNFENMQIKTHRASREVIALYQMDDTQLELNITLPTSYPLEAVSVKPGRRVNNAMNWKNYQMQLSIFLTHQNGSIWEGLKMWKKNLDKRFAGVEECYICFSIFHISTYQIPKLSCHTCRKKFHAPCLYKWFSTSQKSTCPICRNIF